MNFFQAQAKARRSTTLLVLLFLLGVGGTIALTHLLLLTVWAQFSSGNELSVATVMAHNDTQSVFFSAAIVLVIVAGGSWYKLSQLSGGGRVVAEALGGRLIPRGTGDAAERRLLNVVDEMSLASGIAAPPVYLLDSGTINAFAAGRTYDDAVIGITRGAVDALERQELQGVIAHEFSHIFNGDMRLNGRITGVLYGILMIGLIGRKILDVLGDSRGYRRRSSNKKDDGAGAIIMIGVGFTVIGFVGTFFGEIIKATISRQREYLADASAVQYTRDPGGIADALKKIGSAGSKIPSGEASDFSHFYFADGVMDFWDNMFATHPKLDDRIRRIQPRWDGKYLEIVPKAEDILPEEKPEKKKELFTAVSTAAVLDAVDRIGAPDTAAVAQAQLVLEAIPAPLMRMAEHPMTAQAVVLALLSAPHLSVREKQFAYLEKRSMVLRNQTRLALQYTASLEAGLRLPLLQQCIASLGVMSEAQYTDFRDGVRHFSDADGELSLFEWTLERLLTGPLDLRFGLSSEPKERHSHIGAVRSEAEIYLSTLARLQYADHDAARRAFESAVRQAGATALRYDALEGPGYAAFGEAVTTLSEGRLGVRRKVLDMTVDVLSHDGVISPVDLELLHAMAATLRLPLPQVV